MEWGDQEEFLETIWRESGFMPPALMNKPDLLYWMGDYLKAFWVLSGRRSYAMGPNPISFEAMDRYFERFEFDDFEEFLTLMAKLDETYISIMSKRKAK